MRKLKRVQALILALVLLFSTVSSSEVFAAEQGSISNSSGISIDNSLSGESGEGFVSTGKGDNDLSKSKIPDENENTDSLQNQSSETKETEDNINSSGENSEDSKENATNEDDTLAKDLLETEKKELVSGIPNKDSLNDKKVESDEVVKGSVGSANADKESSNSKGADADTSKSESNDNSSNDLYHPSNVPVYGDYETGIAPMALDEYTTGSVSTYKRLDMFNPNKDDGYQILQMGIKYFSSDNNSIDANYLGLKRVIYCMEYSKATPNIGLNFSYRYYGNNAYRPELYVMANGVRYLNHGCTNAYFSTGLGADYDYYVTQIALHLVRGEFSYDYFRGKMLSARNKVPADVKNRVLDCIWNLYNHAVNITTDPNMFYINGSGDKNYMVYSSNGNTHSLEGVASVWTQNSDGVWCSPWAAPMSKDYYGGDLRPFYRGISVSTDTPGVFAHVAYEHGGPVAQGYHLYIGGSRYKELQRTGATITVTVKLSLPNAFAGRMLNFSNNNYQDVEYYGTLTDWGNNEVTLTAKYTIPKEISEGKLYLEKTSSVTSITDGNSCYSLEGAEYTVYKDSACTSSVGKLVTGKDGKSNTLVLESGTYYVKETKAPKGYALDSKVHTVTITDNNLSNPYVLKVKDNPLMDPVSILLKKVDADTMEAVPGGRGTLGGAEFTVKYYDVNSSTDPASNGKTPIRTWVFKTDEDGFTTFDTSYKVRGDDLYFTSSGIPSIPIGTITIQETKAPEGYLLNKEIFVVPITSEGTADSVSTYAIPVIPEDSLKLNLKKIQSGTDKVIEGAVFEHTRPNGEKETLATDKNGKLSFVGLEKGNHVVKEISAPDGYSVNSSEITFTVGENSKVIITSDVTVSDLDGNITVEVNDKGCIDVLVENKVKPYKLQIVKKNNKGLCLEGAEFTLYKDEKCTDVLDTSVSDKNGLLSFDNLMVGNTYYLKETKAPVGYKLPDNLETYKVYVESSPVDDVFDFYINDEKFTVEDTDNSKTIYLSGTKADRVVNMEIVNNTSLLLPETGSGMTLVMVVVGMFMMFFALFSRVENKKYYI